MFIPLEAQTAQFLRACLLGCAAGLLWDVLRGARRAYGLRRRGTAVLDGLYCAVMTGALLLFLLRRTSGALRFYIPAGIALGLWLWRLTLSGYAAALLTGAWRAVRRGGRALRRSVLWLFSFPRGN